MLTRFVRVYLVSEHFGRVFLWCGNVYFCRTNSWPVSLLSPCTTARLRSLPTTSTPFWLPVTTLLLLTGLDSSLPCWRTAALTSSCSPSAVVLLALPLLVRYFPFCYSFHVVPFFWYYYDCLVGLGTCSALHKCSFLTQLIIWSQTAAAGGAAAPAAEAPKKEEKPKVEEVDALEGGMDMFGGGGGGGGDY